MKLAEHQKGMLFAAAGALGWGLSGVCSQFLFTDYKLDPSWLTSIRMILSGPVLLLLAAKRNNIMQPLQNKRDILQLLFFALFGLLLCQYAFLAAIQASNSGTATVLQSLNIVLMAIAMAVWKRTALNKSQLLSVFLAVFGTYLIASGGRLTQIVLSPAGLIWGILSAVGVVSYTLISQGLVCRYGSTTVTGWGMLIGGFVLGAATAVWNIPGNLDIVAYLAIAVVILLGTAGGFSLYLVGAKLIGPVKAALLGCLEPISSTLLSALFLGTSFGLAELWGFSCIIAAVILSILFTPRETAG